MLSIKVVSETFSCGILYLVGKILFADIFVINKGIVEHFLSVCSRKNTINCFPCIFYVFFSCMYVF